MRRYLCLAVFLTLSLAWCPGIRSQEEKAALPETYARVELKGKLVADGKPKDYHAIYAGWKGYRVRVENDNVFFAPPSWELDLGEDKALQESAKALVGHSVRVRGEVHVHGAGGMGHPGSTVPPLRIIVKVTTLERADERK